MCRLALKTASEPFSPYEVLTAMEAMQEGYDGSGLGLLLRGMEFEDFRYNPKFPILSGIAHSDKAWRRLDDFMEERGYELKYDHKFHMRWDLVESKDRYRYFVRAYRMPDKFTDRPQQDRDDELMLTRLALRRDGEQHGGDLTVFSFWPDVTIIKEVGWPIKIGDSLCLHDGQIKSRVCMAQGRQNTNYGINLYACHPFFIEGLSTMTNGENTAFVPIREYLLSRGFPGYMGYQSDSEVFAHIMHFTLNRLQFGIEYYKHVITPLSDAEMEGHPDRALLARIKQTCRKLIIDGPNCVIGCLPDKTMFMVQDRKKLRPGVVGGKPGIFAFSSEICGLDAAIPDRDQHADFQPMHLDTAIVRPECQEVTICNQLQSLPRPH